MCRNVFVKYQQCKNLDLTMYQPLEATCTAELSLRKDEAAQEGNLLCCSAHDLTRDILTGRKNRVTKR